MTQVARLKHARGVQYWRPVDGYIKYTDIDFKNHSHMLVEEIGTEVPINLYLTVLLNPHALHGKGQPEV